MWIPATITPPNTNRVLISTLTRGVRTTRLAYYDREWMDESCPCEPFEYVYPHAEITHWMPLPPFNESCTRVRRVGLRDDKGRWFHWGTQSWVRSMTVYDVNTKLSGVFMPPHEGLLKGDLQGATGLKIVEIDYVSYLEEV